jgi:hypothetical protein
MEDWNAWTDRLRFAWQNIVEENDLAARHKNQLEMIAMLIDCISLEASLLRLKMINSDRMSVEDYMIFSDSFWSVIKKLKRNDMQIGFISAICSIAEIVSDKNEINKYISTEQIEYREKIAPHIEGMNENEYVDFVRSRLIDNEREAERLVLNFILRQYKHFEDPRLGPEATINDALDELVENWQNVTVSLPEDMRKLAIELIVKLSNCLRIHLEIIKTDTSVIKVIDSQNVHDFMEVYTSMRKEFRKLYAPDHYSAGIVLYRLKDTLDEFFSTV